MSTTCPKCSGAGLQGWPQHAYPHAPDCPNLLAEIEAKRQQRHHDVMLLVLKELTREATHTFLGTSEAFRAVLARRVGVTARSVADLAYPPPKGEP